MIIKNDFDMIYANLKSSIISLWNPDLNKQEPKFCHFAQEIVDKHQVWKKDTSKYWINARKKGMGIKCKMGGDPMPGIGILYDRETLRETIIQTLRLSVLEFHLEETVEDIYSFPVSQLSIGQLDKEPGRDFPYVILSQENREKAFDLAEMLWQKEPTISIIYVARTAEDVFAALQIPFFHIVREFNLEQDLRAALRKLSRLKHPMLEKVSFLYNNSRVILRRKDILYLESQHHEILIHVKASDGAQNKEILTVTDSLSSCEEKLKDMGFVRIHKSLLVNMYHIYRLDKESVLLSNRERLYISRYRYAEVRQRLEQYIRKLEFM